MNRSALLCATLLAVLAVYPGEEVRADGRPATRTGISGERSPEPAPVPQVPRRPPWGGTHWTSLAGAAFLPMLSTTAYASGGSGVLPGALTTTVNGGEFEAQATLPNGSLLTGLQVQGYHAVSGGTISLQLLERCLPYTQGDRPTNTLLLTRNINAAGGEFLVFEPIDRHPVSTKLCTYHVNARFSVAGSPPGPVQNMQLVKVRLDWLPDRIFADDLE
jgi:hypothetical protein